MAQKNDKEIEQSTGIVDSSSYLSSSSLDHGLASHGSDPESLIIVRAESKLPSLELYRSVYCGQNSILY